jgi:hypothetical protein
VSNTYYTKTFNAIPDTLVRSAAANNEYLAVEVGFDRAQVKLLAALRAPDGDTLGTLPILADRANKALVFDASGNPAVTVSASSAEMAAAVAAAAAASASAAQAAIDAATLAGSTNALHMLQLQAGIL